MNNHYISFTIGPIFKTITNARKTRELWASSYIFSLLMRRLLEQFKPEEVLLPSIKGVNLHESPYGAGIWPDRCIIQLTNGSLPDVSAIIESTLDKIAQDLNLTYDSIFPFFSIQVLNTDWRKEAMTTGANDSPNDLVAVHRINRLLDNLELTTPFQAVEPSNLNQVLSRQIHHLYTVADYKKNPVFIQLKDRSVRLPSLPEIALYEIKKDPRFSKGYAVQVEEVINGKILELRSKKGRAKDLDNQRSNEQFYLDLKNILPENTICIRHKYVAVVVADGDNLGKTITRISQGESSRGAIADFSNRLQKFARKAVEKIANDGGGLPIYAGGDDLLFLAPITNGDQNVFDLCSSLDNLFKEEMEVEEVGLSFGLAISYYKHPLGEAVQSAYNLQKKAKKFRLFFADDINEENDKKIHKPRVEKHAIYFQLQKHSGQQFGAPLWMGNDENTNLKDKFLKILEPNQKDDHEFLSSAMRKMQNLAPLLADAARNKNLDSFQKNNFNEGGKHDQAFLKDVMKLAYDVFSDYGDVLDPEMIDELKEDPLYKKRQVDLLDLHHTNVLFAFLRLKQFLIQKDYD